MKIYDHPSALERILFLFTFHMFSFNRYNIFPTLSVKRKCLKSASFHKKIFLREYVNFVYDICAKFAMSYCKENKKLPAESKVFVGDICSIFSVLHCCRNLILSVVNFIILIRIEILELIIYSYNLISLIFSVKK